MTLVTTVPKDWVSISNGIERRFDATSNEGTRVLENHGVEWFLDTYENKD